MRLKKKPYPDSEDVSRSLGGHHFQTCKTYGLPGSERFATCGCVGTPHGFVGVLWYEGWSKPEHYRHWLVLEIILDGRRYGSKAHHKTLTQKGIVRRARAFAAEKAIESREERAR